MDLTTTYMGLKLKNPLVPSASPLSADVDVARRLEDAGAAAIVMYSLFEEQITHEAEEIDHYLTTFSESYAEALSYFPEPEAYRNMEAEEYLEQISRLKEALDIPVIASLNGVSPGGWMKFAQKMEQAGADALELNIYYIPTDPQITGEEVEDMYVEDLKAVKSCVSIPVAMKLSPYFSAFANLARRLDEAGADALVLFNRFYQPDIDLETLEVVPNLELSHSYEIRLPLRWIAILYGKIRAGLAATSGVHTAEDVLKLVMAGADVTMMASALLKEGPDVLTRILNDLEKWMEEHEYESIRQMKGSMSFQHVAEPAAWVRANYIKTLQSIR
ncbi:MAG: dihydroorotate dehydrogenase-like protein [Calditrichaeota bacterium]|nr:MAG: dihydroorotate dehydrogenase-like protein [Calditrichota bacterium]